MRVLLIFVIGCAGASFNPSGLDYEAGTRSSQEPLVDSVSLACLGAGRHADRFVPCDGAAVPRSGALVAVWYHSADKQWPAENAIALNDVEVTPTRTVTVDGEAIPVFALADAFPELRRGQDLPPARYHVRVQVMAITGKQTVVEQDVVIQ